MQIVGQKGRILEHLPEIEVAGYGEVMNLKENIPKEYQDIESIRDFGGCYLVHGRYLLKAGEALKCRFLSMVDVSVTDQFMNEVELLRASDRTPEIEVVQGDFRGVGLYDSLRETDAALLYEVLLHQENYMEVLRKVTSKTAKYIFIAQPVLKEEHFSLPGGAVLLQFFDKKLKDQLKQNSFWPADELDFQLFDPRVWMWGHTVSHLLYAMHGYGWKITKGLKVINVAGNHFEYALLVFKRV